MGGIAVTRQMLVYLFMQGKVQCTGKLDVAIDNPIKVL